MKPFCFAFLVLAIDFSSFPQTQTAFDSASATKPGQQSTHAEPTAAPSTAQTPEKPMPIEKANTSAPTIAVMDFGGLNVTKEDAASLTDRFRFELMKTKKFDVMERNEMNLILQEQEFQKTDCVDQSCAVEAGKLIAVKKMIAGTVSKVGGIYSVNAKLLDVQTGRVDQNVNEDCDCPVEKVLTETMQRIAHKLSGLEVTDKKTQIEIRRGDASVFVKTTPDGANMFLDGRMIDGITPVTIENLIAGKHTLKVKKGDLAATLEVDLVSNKVKRLDIILQKQTTVLKIMSVPSDAETYLFGKKPGAWIRGGQLTPAIFENINADTVPVTIFKVGYSDTSFRMPIVRNDENTVSISLREAAAEIIKTQKHLVLHRTLHFAGAWLTPASIVCLAGGGLSYYLGRKDYSTALADKNFLESSAIKGGPEYNAKVTENKNKTDSGNWKTSLAYAIGGVGAVGLALGLVFYF
jgi:TolB-like protein